MSTKDTSKLTVLNKDIDAAHGNANAVQGAYQDVGVRALEHLADHGDVQPVNRIVVGMPKSQRKLAMASWMLAHGALIVNQDKGTKDTMPLKYTKDKSTSVEAAKAEMWYAHLPEREVSDVFDLQVAVKSLLNRCKGKTLYLGGVAAPHEAMAALRAMAGAVGLPVEGVAEATKAEVKPEIKAAVEAAVDAIKSAADKTVPAAVKETAKPTASKGGAKAKGKGRREHA